MDNDIEIMAVRTSTQRAFELPKGSRWISRSTGLVVVEDDDLKSPYENFANAKAAFNKKKK